MIGISKCLGFMIQMNDVCVGLLLLVGFLLGCRLHRPRCEWSRCSVFTNGSVLSNGMRRFLNLVSVFVNIKRWMSSKSARWTCGLVDCVVNLDGIRLTGNVGEYRYICHCYERGSFPVYCEQSAIHC